MKMHPPHITDRALSIYGLVIRDLELYKINQDINFCFIFYIHLCNIFTVMIARQAAQQ